MRITTALTPSTGAPFEIVPLDLDDPRPGEVLVRIVGSGICHTDLIVRDQWYPVPLPAVLGHEGSGIVEAIGPGVTSVAPGDHVVLTYNSCGQCRSCAHGRSAYCDEIYTYNFAGTRPDGTTTLRRDGTPVYGAFFGQSAFASHALANQRNVVKVDPAAPLELLGPLGCGIQTGAGGVLNALRPAPGTSIAVFGSGSVGLSAIMASVIAGCTTIIAVDLNDRRLDLAEELGATHTVNADREDVVDRIRAATGGLGVDFTLETTAIPAVLRQAVDALNQGGTCGHIGAARPGTEVSLDMAALMFGRTVRGIVEGDSIPSVFIPRLVTLFKQGRFPIDKLITTYAFENINGAVQDAEKGLSIKSVLTFK
ncbi:NAD(P)-dependent alcohol dehydrogenase [Streptomyces sp. Li-HN-5-11]|uniref:NAD(P)-dependent alcohol dehydrogenase n=1 Tax=Streptomyces sp. Li-HN-5-11 TaxID=3075432 RepID=UPI0028B1CE08|nr:NAD(P)-dependent alcohol dehydrogenase [Streptomyces sp. Li-HN-5-11]WNM35713.1 NAD(P)-dependent alcohol dehydrogenase [Streptomyces sp. Li-HN-5-11]